MKDLKLVLLFALPVVAIVAAILVVNAKVDPSPPAKTYDDGGAVDDLVDRARDQPVPERWPAVDHPQGSPPRAPTEGSDDFDWSLTPDRLRELLAKGDQVAWSTIQQLISQGEITDEHAIAKLLVDALGKDPLLSGVWIAKLIPLLVSRQGEVRDQVVGDLLTLARAADHPNTIKSAAMAIGSIADSSAVSSLRDLALASENPNAAGAAIRAIGEIGSREPSVAAAELARLVTELDRPELGQSLYEAMRLVHSIEMVNALLPLTGPEVSQGVRLVAINALGATRLPEAVPLLSKFTREGSDPKLAVSAIVALGRHGSKEAVEHLIELTRKGGDLGKAAGGIIGEARGRGIYRPILDNFGSAPTPMIKGRWLEAIRASGEPAAIPGVREIFQSGDSSNYVRGKAALTLAKLGDQDSAADIVNALEDSRKNEVQMRCDLIRAMENLVPRSAPDVRKKAIRILEGMIEDGIDDAADIDAQRALNRFKSR